MRYPVPVAPGHVPSDAAGIDRPWLSAVLGGRYPGLDLAGVSVSRTGEAYGLASLIYRVAFTPTGAPSDVPSSVVVKLWDTSTRAGTGEIDFYRDIAPTAGIPVPVCLAAGVDDVGNRGVLVLEDLAPCRQGDANETLDDTDLAAVITALSGFAARWWNSQDPALSGVRSVRRSPRLVLLGAAGLAERRSAFVARFGRCQHPLVTEIIDSAVTWLAWSDDVLADAPETLLHEDMHLDNVLFRHPAGTPYFLDWTRVATGPAALTATEIAFQFAPTGRHLDVLTRYAAGLAAPQPDTPPVIGYHAADLLRHVGGALVRKVVTWTLGIAPWVPTSAREKRMVELSLQRADDAVTAWSAHDPGWGPRRA